MEAFYFTASDIVSLWDLIMTRGVLSCLKFAI